jgi:hypothetical protein
MQYNIKLAERIINAFPYLLVSAVSVVFFRFSNASIFRGFVVLFSNRLYSLLRGPLSYVDLRSYPPDENIIVSGIPSKRPG